MKPIAKQLTNFATQNETKFTSLEEKEQSGIPWKMEMVPQAHEEAQTTQKTPERNLVVSFLIHILFVLLRRDTQAV